MNQQKLNEAANPLKKPRRSSTCSALEMKSTSTPSSSTLIKPCSFISPDFGVTMKFLPHT